MEPSDLVRAVVDPTRLAVLGRLVGRPRTAAELAEETGHPARAVLEALGALTRWGLVLDERGRYRLDDGALREVARNLPSQPPPDPTVGYGMTDDERRILARFFRGRQLLELPAQHGKRVVVCQRLALEFEPGVRYTEAQVNETMAVFHDDVAALRRALVDEGFLERDGREYWRSGGRVDLDGSGDGGAQ